MRAATSSVILAFTTLLLGTPVVPSAASERAAPGTSSEALRIARASQPSWRLGRLVAREHDRRRHFEAELLSDGTPIARLRVEPGTGRFLPRDERAAPAPAALDPTRLRPQVVTAIAGLEVGSWAWPVEHGRAWAIPLRWEGRVVGAIRVDVSRRRVLAVRADDDEDDD